VFVVLNISKKKKFFKQERLAV